MLRKSFCATLLATLVLAAAFAPVAAAEKEGTLCTKQGADITDTELRAMLDAYIPTEAKSLLTFTQCYGGDCVDNFAGMPNTAVTSATSPGQKASYGGYDDDAAGALRPGGGTGQTVHDTGTAGKASGETPMTGGGMSPADFPLDPADVSIGSDVWSRHIVVYAGLPDSGAGRDNDQAARIKAQFAGEPNTTVTTVGGDGTGGWDAPGTAAGLAGAIRQAGQAIESSPVPANEQFILFVTDHGDLHNKQSVQTTVAPQQVQQVQAVQSFQTGDLIGTDLITNPGFSIRVELPIGITHPGYAPGDPAGYIPFFQPGEWMMDLNNGIDPMFNLINFTELFVEQDGDGIIGNNPGECVEIFFEMDPNWWVDSFFDVTYDVDIFNNSPHTINILDVSQDTGQVAKVPEPTTLALLSLGLGLLAARKRKAA